MPDSSSVFLRDPNSVLDFQFNWADWLAAGETITGTPTVTVPTGLVKDSQSNTTTTVTVWISGGTDGVAYDVACRVVTTQGRTDDRTIRLVTKHR